jgi:hydroxymethylpyrimidine pyrophosphatase-like HAD family hydrolase
MAGEVRVHGLFLDFDGTISPVNILREEARVPGETQQVLKQISRTVPVGIITTKDLHFIEPRTPFATAWCAVGGLEIKVGDMVTIDHRVPKALPFISAALAYAKHCSNGHLFIEEKTSSGGETIAFCVDWRHSQEPEEAKARAGRILTSFQRLPLSVVEYRGQPFFDVYPCRVDKGKALVSLKRTLGLCDGIMYLGDSKVDNPAFKVADVGIGVRHAESAYDLQSQYYINFEDVPGFFLKLASNDMLFSPEYPEIKPAERRN